MNRSTLLLAITLAAGALLAPLGAGAQQPPAGGGQPLGRPGTPLPSVQQPLPTVTLPNGATSINETFGDWTVDCRIANGQRLCVLSQAQGDNRTGQRVFAIELRTPKDGQTQGTILMPFGLRLENGALLKLDDRDLGQGLRFSTCVPSGCLLPVSLPTVATDAMKAGQRLTVAALNLSTGEPVSFNVSLNGFAAALGRIADLDK